MDNKLSNIAVRYRKFSKGQYIEKTHFNEFLDYFEDQDRLSRVMLEGVGVVCGFKPKLVYIDKQLDNIQLSQGVAITTDGDLLTLNKTSEVSKDLYVSDLKTINIENQKYTHFKAYDNFKVGYAPFYDDKKTNQIELWELATAEEATSDFQPINNLSNLENKCILLYLEDYEKDIKPCRGVDCDNHGIQQIRNLKVLVTTEKQMAHIIGKIGFTFDPITGEAVPNRRDSIQPHPLFLKNIMKPLKQERIVLERLISNKEVDAPILPSDIKKLYQDVLQKNNFGQAIFDNIDEISKLIGEGTTSHPGFKSILEYIFTQETGFQYAYDVVQDLADTYAEIIRLLPKAFTQFLPDLISFPKHIMLGKLIPNKQLDPFRHQFYNSPVLDQEKAMQKVKLLISRFNLQIQNFRVPNIKNQIRITPSHKLNPLSNKAVPFYYDTTQEFLRTWNFDKTSSRSSLDNVRYASGFVTTDPRGPVNFIIDKSSFYNIEGHQGMDHREAFDKIKEIRDQQQLGFDIMALSLQELANNKELSIAYFNEYAEAHPGLEHKRGVERGGTFVIVYDNRGRDTKVVADFSLPYICCTPKIDVKLSLPSPVICAKSEPVPFTVYPMNGDVRAVVSGSLNGGVVLLDGRYFLDPSLVSAELYNKDISFTVNGKATKCTVKVLPQPDIEVKVDSITYPKGDSKDTIVSFKILGENIADYTYSWDFWDNGRWVNLTPDEKGIVTYAFSELDIYRIPTVKVKVISGDCAETIEVNLPLTENCPVVSNIIYSVVDNDNGNQTFTFNWDLPSDLSTVTGLNIFVSDDPEKGWSTEYGSYSPRRTVTRPIGKKYYFRFGLVGSCREEGGIAGLPGFNSIGIGPDENNHPPTVSIKWKDTSVLDERLCREAVCNFTIVVSADDEDNDIDKILIYKSIEGGTSILFAENPEGNVFSDSISKVGKQSYQVVVTDKKGNKGSSNILSYRKESHAPSVSIKWNDTPGNADRYCTQPVCSYSIEVLASDDDGDIKEIQVHKSTDGGSSWIVFKEKLSGNVFEDYINNVGINSYKAVVVDEENNEAVSDILNYKKEYRPTIEIDSITPNASCCIPVSSTITAEVDGPKDVNLSEASGFGLKALSDASDPLFFWSKLKGPDVRLIGTNANLLAVTDLSPGDYRFRLLVKERNSSVFATVLKEVIVKE